MSKSFGVFANRLSPANKLMSTLDGDRSKRVSGQHASLTRGISDLDLSLHIAYARPLAHAPPPPRRHKELTADDFIAIIAKLVSLHTTNTKAAVTHTRETKIT